jgi:hypothetical protein
MLTLYIVAAVLIVVGSWFSLLRSASTIDYYRTIVRDGRNDPYARWVVVRYYAGLCSAGLGLLLLACALLLTLLNGE